MRGFYGKELSYRPLTYRHRSYCSSLYFRHSFIEHGFNPVPHWRAGLANLFLLPSIQRLLWKPPWLRPLLPQSVSRLLKPSLVLTWPRLRLLTLSRLRLQQPSVLPWHCSSRQVKNQLHQLLPLPLLRRLLLFYLRPTPTVMEWLPSVMQEHALLQTPTLSVLPTQSATTFMEATLLSVLLQATVSDAVVIRTATARHPTVTTISSLISSLVGRGFKMCRRDLRLSAFCVSD